MLRIAMTTSEPGVSRIPHLVALCETLTTSGHDVAVFTRDLRAGLRAYRPDVIHAHHWSDEACAAARSLDVPFVVTTRADSRERAADHVIATYSGQQRQLIAAGVPRENISVVPHGVDIDHFTPDGEHPDRRRPHRVIALGDMAPPSGFGTAVAALPAVPDAELVLVTQHQQGTHAAELRDYARALGVADRLHLLGPVPTAEVPALLRSADLMVCSPWEPIFGTAAIEAMACGLAVVANGTGGLADSVVDRVTGVHVRPRKPRDLAAMLRRMLHHKPMCEQLGASGRDRATARYAWDQVAAETLHAYRRAGAPDPAVLAQETATAERKRASRASSRG